jgi:hypothetical protein
MDGWNVCIKPVGISYLLLSHLQLFVVSNFNNFRSYVGVSKDLFFHFIYFSGCLKNIFPHTYLWSSSSSFWVVIVIVIVIIYCENSSPEMHGTITGTFKNQIDWIPLNTGSVRPTQGKSWYVYRAYYYIRFIVGSGFIS